MRHSKTGYTRCSPPVCLMLTTRIPGTWEIFAKRPESGMCLHPVSPMNRELDEKRWSRWKGQKIYRKDILKNKKHTPEKRCYIFFETCTSSCWNLLHLFLKGAMCFWKRCYVFKQTGVTNWWRYMDFDWHCHNLFFHDYKVGLFERKPYIWK